MIRTPQERQAWYDTLKAVFARPDPATRHGTGDQVFTRTLAKRCPWCGDVFFTYQLEGHEREPYRVDPNPPGGMGARDTCGHPMCREAEHDYQFKRRMSFRSEKPNEPAA